MSGRNAALRGNNIELTAIFLDAAGEYTTPTSLRVSIYPPGFNPENGGLPADAWVYEATTTSGGSGPESNPSRLVEEVSTGIYRYTFSIPEDSALGASYDQWQGTIDLEDLNEVFTFTIVGGGSVGTTQLYENNIVFIEVDKDITATDGTTLGETFESYFTTTYNPLYTSSSLVRLDLGSLIRSLSDDTINFAIFSAGRSVDANTFLATPSQISFFQHSRQQYVQCFAKLILIQGLLGDIIFNSKMSKRLGDLSVSRSGDSNVLKGLEDKLKKELEQWKRAVQTGGDLAPGTSLRADYSVKGANADDAITVSRQWEPTTTVGRMPLGNTTTATTNSRRRLVTGKTWGQD
jgi:hypothetical protein